MNAEVFYRLAPNRVWRTYLGGGTLDAISGAAAPEDTHFPEDWILSTTRAVNAGRETIEEGVSSVLSDSGRIPLTELLDRFPAGGIRRVQIRCGRRNRSVPSFRS